MKLDIFNSLLNETKNNKIVESFMKELSDFLNKSKGKEIDILREEDCLYQVVDRSFRGVYLQNMSTKQVFEETEMPKEILDKISNDYILRFKDGNYIIEEELTDMFFEDLEEL